MDYLTNRNQSERVTIKFALLEIEIPMGYWEAKDRLKAAVRRSENMLLGDALFRERVAGVRAMGQALARKCFRRGRR